MNKKDLKSQPRSNNHHNNKMMTETMNSNNHLNQGWVDGAPIELWLLKSPSSSFQWLRMEIETITPTQR